jgi:hypothetical protein
MAGVGASKPRGYNGWQIPTGQFILRHLQAMKLQAIVEGSGEMPKWMKKAADTLAIGYGHKGFEAIPLPSITVGGKVLSAEEMYRMAQSHGVISDASKLWDLSPNAVRSVWKDVDPTVRLAVENAPGIDPLTKEALDVSGKSTLLEIADKNFGRDNVAVRANRALGSIVENNLRLSLFLDRMDKSEEATRAAQATKMWHIDYRNLTDVERKVFRNIIPFYSWTRFMFPRIFMAMIENPGRMAKIPKIEGALRRLSMDYQDLPTPDWYDESRVMQLPFVRNSKPLVAQVDTPVLELNHLNWHDTISSLNPFIKLPLESTPAGGLNFFTGEQMEAFPGEKSDVIPGATKIQENALSSFFPPAGKVTRMIRAYKQGTGPEQMASELAGVRIRPLDVRRVLRAQTFEKRKLARDFRRTIAQESGMEQ